jgi:hypothetical protein
MPFLQPQAVAPAYEKLIPEDYLGVYRIFTRELWCYMRGRLRRNTPDRDARATELAEAHLQAMGDRLLDCPVFWGALLGGGCRGLTPIQLLHRAARVASRNTWDAGDLGAAQGFIPVDEFLFPKIVRFRSPDRDDQ